MHIAILLNSVVSKIINVNILLFSAFLPFTTWTHSIIKWPCWLLDWCLAGAFTCYRANNKSFENVMDHWNQPVVRATHLNWMSHSLRMKTLTRLHDRKLVCWVDKTRHLRSFNYFVAIYGETCSVSRTVVSSRQTCCVCGGLLSSLSGSVFKCGCGPSTPLWSKASHSSGVRLLGCVLSSVPSVPAVRCHPVLESAPSSASLCDV